MGPNQKERDGKKNLPQIKKGRGRKEEEDNLGLSSRADQGPWNSARVVGIDLKDPVQTTAAEEGRGKREEGRGKEKKASASARELPGALELRRVGEKTWRIA